MAAILRMANPCTTAPCCVKKPPVGIWMAVQSREREPMRVSSTSRQGPAGQLGAHDARDGGVAPEHAAVAIGVVGRVRIRLGHDEQHAPVLARGDQAAHHVQREEERAARCPQIERRRLAQARFGGDEVRGRRDLIVADRERADDQIDRGQVDALEREPRRARAQLVHRLLLGPAAPLADADVLDDPLVAGVDHPREVRVRQDLVGPVGAQAGDEHRGSVGHCGAAPRSTASQTSSPVVR
jgi:hypothetical protein